MATGGNAVNATTATCTLHDPAKPTAITTNAQIKRLTMTDDIVTRLLALNHADAADAADEIERLRSMGQIMFNSINYLLGENQPTEDLADLLDEWKRCN